MTDVRHLHGASRYRCLARFSCALCTGVLFATQLLCLWLGVVVFALATCVDALLVAPLRELRARWQRFAAQSRARALAAPSTAGR